MPREGDVILLRWPAESARRARCQAMGVLRLLVVEGGVPAPICSDICEDWVRAPISDADLWARMATLAAKAAAYRLPQIDPYGILRFSGRSSCVSPTETELLECLIRQFGALVPREELHDCLPQRPSGGGRNALDLHIMRLRRRIHPLGLAIQTVRGRGYMLQAAADAAEPRREHAGPETGTCRDPQSASEAGVEVTRLRWPPVRVPSTSSCRYSSMGRGRTGGECRSRPG